MEPEISKGGVEAISNIGAAKMQDNFAEFTDHQSLNFGVILLWIAAVIALLATIFFWWSSSNTTDILAEKQSEKDNIIQQILSPSYKDVEQKASDFKSSVNQLKEASKERYSIDTFNKTLFSRINKDITISSYSLAADGTFALAGEAASYRIVADQMMSLKDWDGLKDVDLTSIAADVESGNYETINFSITAKINKVAVSTSLVTDSSAPETTSAAPNPTEAQ